MSMILTNLQPSRYGSADQAGAFNEATARRCGALLPAWCAPGESSIFPM